MFAAPASAQAGTATLTYLNAPAPGTPITEPPRLSLSFGGSTLRAVMDTGSTGIVVAADAIPGAEKLPGPNGVLTYSSSGRIMRGRWLTVPATIAGADGRITTAPLPVLAVTREDCLAQARNCKPLDHPQHVAVIGIGFGREADHQPQSTPDHNPFLAVPGIRQPGYIVTSRTVRVGLDGADLHGFATVALTRSDRWPDWNQAPACIAAGDAPPTCGLSLMDTGVVRMYLSVPGAPLHDGTALRFLLGGEKTVVTYGFTMGQHASPMAPESVVVTSNTHPFVNLTVRFLNGFDYFFDSTSGEVGYRKR